MRALALLIARLLERAAYKLQAAALAGAGIVAARKPPQSPPAEPHALRSPTPDELDRARGAASARNLPRVKVCRGPGKACGRTWQQQTECPDCYVIHWHDRRPSAEIVRAMERGDA